MLTLREISRALGGKVVGRTVRAPGPGHSRKDNSLCVWLNPSGLMGIFSHAGDDFQICNLYVREKLGLPAWRPGDGYDRPGPTRPTYQARDNGPNPDEVRRKAAAIEVWEGGYDWRDTPVVVYLASRSLKLDSSITSKTIRFHPRCPWVEDDGEFVFIPALIAAFRSANTDEITGVHRIRLDKPALWPKPGGRKMLGLVKGSAIKFGEAGSELAIGEGIETCLAAHRGALEIRRANGHRQQVALRPVWALGSVQAIGHFPLIAGVRLLRVLAEAGEASVAPVAACRVRWASAGRLVRIIQPPDGCSDLNDVLMRDNVA